MKNLKIAAIAFFTLFFIVNGLPAQSRTGMSLSGATGLYSIPSGRIGWEHSGASAFGLDLGYHTIIVDGVATHIPKVALSLFSTVELSFAFDIQPELHNTINAFGPDNGPDFIGGIKIQLPLTRTALAIGGNYQHINMGQDNNRRSAGQVYIAATYAGHFFDMPAETTIVIGRTFIQGHSNSNIDFGMGFDMILLPRVFDGLIHWITDFANFSYSVDPFRADAWNRGVLNTGIRFNLSTIPALNRFRMVLDIMILDAFDQNRAFSTGLTFGVPLN